eukprot:6208991-Pleurochrysis_carterae.AAC.2
MVYADREAQLPDEGALQTIFHHGEGLAREVQSTEQALSAHLCLREAISIFSIKQACLSQYCSSFRAVVLVSQAEHQLAPARNAI